jgi:hypothetical protein
MNASTLGSAEVGADATAAEVVVSLLSIYYRQKKKSEFFNEVSYPLVTRARLALKS